jgi:capsular polysaccharide biosynthesis protein
MMDYLPRLLLARSLGHAEGARVLLDGRAGPAGHEYLAALGLGPDELIVKPADRAVRVERLIVPSFLSRTGCVYPPAVELLRRFFQPVVPAPGRRRIYISRRGWRQRRLENEAEIEGALAERGFEIAAPERMTMADQIGLFSAAAIVAMPHGGALANMIFAPPGSQIVEIMTKFQPAGISIAGHCGQTHWHVKPEPVDDARDAFRQPLSPFLQLIDAASASQSRGP